MTTKRDRQREQPTRFYENKRSKLIASMGVPQIPEKYRKFMELGYEPTPEMEREMEPYIAAAREQFKGLHLQELRRKGGRVYQEVSEE